MNFPELNATINPENISYYLMNGGIRTTNVPVKKQNWTTNHNYTLVDDMLKVAICNPRPSKVWSEEADDYVDSDKGFKVDLIYFYEGDQVIGKRGNCDIRESIAVSNEGVISIDKRKFFIGTYKDAMLSMKLNILDLDMEC
jgi:hypothetical protein